MPDDDDGGAARVPVFRCPYMDPGLAASLRAPSAVSPLGPLGFSGPLPGEP